MMKPKLWFPLVFLVSIAGILLDVGVLARLGQGLLTDTPFFVTESARLPAAVQHLGHEPL